MVKSWAEKGPTTKFGNQEYYWTLGKCLQIEDVIKKHSDIMDAKDPHKRIGLLVDEWGTWWNEEASIIQGHLYQQNTIHGAHSQHATRSTRAEASKRPRACLPTQRRFASSRKEGI
jgi:hypothetical protein